MEDFTSKDDPVLKKSLEELEEEMGLYFVTPEKNNDLSLILEEEEQ
ncbi:hypothetical protein V7147_08330 [Bacillus sp. JJ1521]